MWRLVQLCSSSNILWHCLGIEMKTDLFQSWGHCWFFQICWYIECTSLTASSYRIWNGSAGIPSPPPALFVVTIMWFYLLFCEVIYHIDWFGYAELSLSPWDAFSLVVVYLFYVVLDSVHSIILCVCFFGISCDFSSFISCFVYLGLLSFLHGERWPH